MALLLALLAGGAAAAGETDDGPRRLPAPPFAVDLGPPSDEAREREGRPRGVPVLADRPYLPGRAHGHVGGEGFRRWFSLVWGHPEPHLFRSGHVAFDAYRLDVPPGEYVLVLGFCEGELHVPGRRVFDVLAGGDPLVEALDPFAAAGLDQAFTISRRVRAGGDGLAIELRPRRGETLLNALWVWPARERDQPPRPPPGFHAAASYAANVLWWERPADPGVAGCVVERRRVPEERFEAIVEEPLPVSRWIDREVEPGVEYAYRVASVDIDGHRGPWSEPAPAIPRNPDDSSLPFYSIELDTEALEYMLGDVHEDRAVRGSLAFRGERVPIEMRIRGASTRLAAKKSWRVRFTEDVPLARRVTYLKAEPQDPTLQQEKLTCDVFAAVGLPVSQAAFVNLSINGRHQGVLLDIEPVRSPFKRRAGLDPAGTLLRARSFGHLELEPPGELRGGAGRIEELEEFLRRVNRVDRGELEAFVRGATDWPRVRDYLAASVLCHRSEIEADDSFYYRDPGSGRWSLIPWDHNNGNFGLVRPADGPEEPFMPLFGQTLQGTGHRHRYWFVLASRVLHCETLREEYLVRLEELTRGLLLGGEVDAMIDANFAALRAEALLDPFRWPPGRDEPFLRSRENLRRFVRRHGERLLRLIGEERRRAPHAVVISEFRFGPEDGWVELENRGPRPARLAGYALGDVEGRHARFRIDDREPIAPGGRRVLSFPFRPLPERRLDDRDDDARELDAEARERRELAERERRRRHFPGFDPAGGTVGLFAPAWRERDEEDTDADDGALADWFFYGRQQAGRSYGRAGSERGAGAERDAGERFGFMRPTPGEPNAAELAAPPPLLADGGVEWRDGRPRTVRAVVTDLCPGPPPGQVTLHYRIDGGPWAAAEMALGDEGTRATADLPPVERAEEVRYWFRARAAGGLERRAPLTAPADAYRSRAAGE